MVHKWENIKITTMCGTGQKMYKMQICVVYVMDQFFDTFMYIGLEHNAGIDTNNLCMYT